MNTAPYRNHLDSSASLVTPYEATRAGFVELALEKNRKATPFIAEARALKVAASRVHRPQELLDVENIRTSLLTAAGVSAKASAHLTDEDKTEAIHGLIDNFLEPAGDNFVEELVYRFLLTKGDALGGAMRNLGGVLGERKLTRAIISALSISGRKYYWLHSKSGEWISSSGDDTDIELHLKGLSWGLYGNFRTLIYNLTVPLVRKNVDLCLFDCHPGEVILGRSRRDSAHYQPKRYIAFGELKGGIDPAGADEHWKTANSALDRIRRAFSAKGLTPFTFFVGAAIETSMSEEIFTQLESGILTNGANLTNADQVASICDWIVRL